MTRLLLTLVAVLAAVALVAAACGPESAVDEGGDVKDPLTLARVLPTADGLTEVRTAQAAGPDELAEALVGEPDPAIAERLRSRGLGQAAVRRWEGADGAELVVATSSWPSHVTATSVGAQAAELLLDGPGARAWTPADVPGARGARVETGDTARALAFAVGPNSLYVRADGPVEEEVVVESVKRLRLVAGGGAAQIDGS